MKIIFNKKLVNGPWGGANQILHSLIEYLTKRGHIISYNLDTDADVVVIMDVRDASCSFPMNKLYDFKNKNNVRIIHRVNDNGSHRKGNDERSNGLMMSVNKLLADKTIFISEWIKKYYEQRGLVTKDSVIIRNGVDRKYFCPNPNFIIRKQQEPIKIITHHWSPNMSKGYEIYDKLSNFCNDNPNIARFKFMGRCPVGMLKNCEKIPPMPYQEIPNILMDEDAYVTATLFESGGCHIIEGMACGLIPLVRIGGGGTEDYSSGYGYYYSTFEELIEHIINLRNNYDLFLKSNNNIRQNYIYSSEDMVKKYCEVICED